MFELTGKSAIVTGGGTGLGKVIAGALVKAGASVLITGRREEVLKDAVAEIGGSDGKIIFAKTDVKRREDVDAMTEKALSAFGKIDILVNNAGINIVKPFLRYTEKEWDDVVDTTLKGCFHCCQAVGQGMVERGSGSIINMTSVIGITPLMNLSPYATSRGGIVTLTKALAVEWGRNNVRVNAIAPSYIRAGMSIGDIENDEKILKQNMRRIPLGRAGEADEVPGAVVFLASEASTFITGTVIPIDGGWTAW